jgi:hypothetical protein
MGKPEDGCIVHPALAFNPRSVVAERLPTVNSPTGATNEDVNAGVTGSAEYFEERTSGRRSAAMLDLARFGFLRRKRTAGVQPAARCCNRGFRSLLADHVL